MKELEQELGIRMMVRREELAKDQPAREESVEMQESC